MKLNFKIITAKYYLRFWAILLIFFGLGFLLGYDMGKADGFYQFQDAMHEIIQDVIDKKIQNNI